MTSEHVEYYILADFDTIETAHAAQDHWADAQLYAAELTYFHTHNAVPEWSVILDRVIEENDSCIFVCRDYRENPEMQA